MFVKILAFKFRLIPMFLIVPSSDELKKLMRKHGGGFQQYYSRTKCTHIVATNLPDSKIKELRYGNGRKGGKKEERKEGMDGQTDKGRDGGRKEGREERRERGEERRWLRELQFRRRDG